VCRRCNRVTAAADEPVRQMPLPAFIGLRRRPATVLAVSVLATPRASTAQTATQPEPHLDPADVTVRCRQRSLLGRIACTDCKGAAYCYRCSVVCVSVGHVRGPYKNGGTCRNAVWGVNLGGPEEPRIRWGPDSPKERQFRGRHLRCGLSSNSVTTYGAKATALLHATLKPGQN